jgi:hypothetical protein
MVVLNRQVSEVNLRLATFSAKAMTINRRAIVLAYLDRSKNALSQRILRSQTINSRIENLCIARSGMARVAVILLGLNV